MQVCLLVQRAVVGVLLWGVRLGLVDRGGETMSHHLVLWSKNHEYSALT